MVVVTKGAIHLFAEKHANALLQLNGWYAKAKEAQWRNFNEVKRTFNSADSIGNDRYVFNIGGNNFRIIAMIHFSIRTVYIRAILTHPQYDILNKQKKLQQL